MIYRCICGRQKTGQPYNSAFTKKWVCSSVCAKAWLDKEKKPISTRRLFANAGQALVKTFSVALCILVLASICQAKPYRAVKQPRKPLEIPQNVDPPPKQIKTIEVASPLEGVPIIGIASSVLAPAVIPARTSQVLTSIGVGCALAVTITGGIFLYKRNRRNRNYGFHNPSRYAQLIAEAYHRRAGQELDDCSGTRSEQPPVLPQFLEPGSRGAEQRRHGDHSPTVRPRPSDDAVVWEWARGFPTQR